MQICICRIRVKEWIKISDLLFFQEGPGVRNTQYTQSGVKLLNVANLVNGKVDLSTSDRYISEDEAYGRYKHFLCDDGDFIIASSGIKVEYFDRKMGFVDSSMLPLCMNTSTIRFKVIDSKRLNIKYFMYYLKSIHFKQQLSKFITGSAQLNFGPSHLKKMNMALVSLKEQNDIVEKLSKVELLLDKYNGEIKLLDELIKARFVEMFGDVGMGLFNYQTCKLGDVAKVGSSHRVFTTEFVESGIPFYRGTEIGELANGKKPINPYYISEEHYKRLAEDETKPLIGDLLMPSICNKGQVWMVDSEEPFYYKDGRVLCISPNKEVFNSRFLQYFMREKTLVEYPKIGSGSTFAEFKIFLLKDMDVLVPPLELQNQFASFVQEIDKSRSRIQKSLEASQELFDSLMQKYFG